MHTLEDLEACKFLQEEELEVLESIYPECISSRQSDGYLKLEIPVELSTTRSVKLVKNTSNSDEEKVSLSVLPPILLQILLPASYPLYGAPTIISIRATYEWIPEIISLKRALTDMWTSEGVLYRWIEYMHSGEFMQDLNIDTNDDDSLLITSPNPLTLASLLSTYQSSSQSAQFSKATYSCGICLEYLKGSRCFQLACKHVFCRSCLIDFWGMCIAEGDVDRVGCPDPDCVKEGGKSAEEEVSHIVSGQELERWRWLTTKQELERDPTTMNCPVPRCQKLIPKPKGIDPNSGWDRFRQFPDCFCSFCSFCKHTWHGPLSSCPLPFTDRLLTDYLAAEEGSPERAVIESRYGKDRVASLLRDHEEQKATDSWITESTSVCPGCQTHVQKSEGCNHMTCTRCLQHFCYRCGVRLDSKNPYPHFNIPGTFCYQKLFAPDDDVTWQENDGEDDSDEDDNPGFQLFD